MPDNSLVINRILKTLPDIPNDPLKPADNLAYRDFVNDRASRNADFAQAIIHKIKSGPDGLIFYNNLMSWTLDPRLRKTSPHIPMIAFPKQERFMRFVQRKIDENENWGSRKSRAFGLTWGVLVPFVWMWQHDENAFLLMASREEALVDSAKNTDSLMKKLDYHIARLPQWYRNIVLPGYETRTGTKYRNFKAMENPLTGGIIIGESTKGNLARGGRKTAGFIDEAAAVQQLDDIIASISEVTYSMGFISTDLGLANPFAKLWQGDSIEFFDAPEGADWQSSPFWLGYTDKVTKVFIEGKTYKCEPDCSLKHHKGGGHDHSDRYDAFCKRVNWDSRKVAQELDREASVAGGSVFDVVRVKRAMDLLGERLQDGTITLTNHSLEFVRPENVHVNDWSQDDELYRERGTWPVRVSDDKFGPVQIWKKPFSCRDTSCICGGTGKHVYCLAVDTSSGYATSDGAGGLMLDCTLGAIVAKLYGQFHTTALALEVVKLAKYYGTSSGNDIDAWTIIEANGEGATVNRICDQHGLFLHKDIDLYKTKGKRGNRLGIYVNTNKNALLAENIEAVMNGGEGDLPQLVCPFLDFLDQCLTFIECAPNTVDQKAEKTKKAAQKGAKDDLVMMANHAVFGAKCRYGDYRGVLRPDEERLCEVNFVLDNTKHFATQSIPEWSARKLQRPVQDTGWETSRRT
jgi:hypothetical protein